MERRQIDGPAAGVLARCPDAAVYTADRSVLQALTGYALTRGVLCAMRRPQPRSVEALCRDARRVAVLEGIVDSTNIGAIFRGAAALGMDAVLLSPSCCDPFCRRAVRVSMGTVFQVPWATLGDSPADWPEAGMARLHALGFKTAAMALDSRAVSIDDPALRAEPRLAIVLGTEGDGLARTTIADCDYTVMIPMQHGVDSLNVAAAGPWRSGSCGQDNIACLPRGEGVCGPARRRMRENLCLDCPRTGCYGKAAPHPTSLRSATFPTGEGFCALRQSATKILQNFYALLTETSAGLVVLTEQNVTIIIQARKSVQ